MKTELIELIEKLEGLKIKHLVCEDIWYSCPLSETGSADERLEGCTCGAENHNNKVIELIEHVRSLCLKYGAK